MRGDRVRAISPAEHLIRELYSITVDHGCGLSRQVERLLNLGCHRLGLEIGIVARIEGDEYHVVRARTPDDSIVPGDKFALADTFCERTLTADGPVGFAHAGATEWKHHPCYGAFGLEAYLGIPLRTPSGVFGTLNFSSARPRPAPFDELDFDAIGLMSAWIEGELSRRELSERIAQIERLIPMCSSCKSVRTELGDWQSPEQFFTERGGLRFSHGLCPSCAPRMLDE